MAIQCFVSIATDTWLRIVIPSKYEVALTHVWYASFWHHSRHLPKALHNAKKRKSEAVEKERRKDKNRRKYTKEEDRVDIKEKAASVVKVVD